MNVLTWDKCNLVFVHNAPNHSTQPSSKDLGYDFVNGCALGYGHVLLDSLGI